MTQNYSKNELYTALRESAQFLHQSRPAEALVRLQPFHEAGMNDPDLAINIGGSYILQRKWDKAVGILAAASKVHPDNVMVWTNLAAAYLGRLETAGPQQQAQAIKAYEQALAINPKTPNVHYHLGLIYKEQGDLNHASAFFQRAIEVNPTDQDALYWLVRLDKISVAARQTDQTGDADGTVNNNTDDTD